MPFFNNSEIPYIDPNVEYVSPSRLRGLNAEALRSLDKTLVIQHSECPLAVLLTYERFLSMQRELQSLQESVDLLFDDEEADLMGASFGDALDGEVEENK